MAGIDMLAVPYKGTGQAVIDLVAGHIHMFFMSPLVAITNVKAGKLRALAVTSMKRNRGLPDVPTVDESGVPGFKYITWHSIMAPGGTPKPIVQRLSGEIAKIVHLPDVQQRLQQQGLEAVGSTPEELGTHIQEESVIFAQLVKAIGYQPQ
jgi:tripartite-type tricarboxylate transporter receptor subunit TctC